MKPAPRIVSNEVAVRIFYEYPFELENSELKILFGTKSTSTLTKIKKEVQRVMMENNIPRRSATSISTKTAYD